MGDARGGSFEGQPGRLLQTVLTYLPDSRVRDRILELAALPNNVTVAEIEKWCGSSGYVVESVPLALYAAREIESLPLDVVLRNVIEAGGDTDTIASMTGQIAGSWIGASQVPVELINSLPTLSEIEEIIDKFAGVTS